MGLGNFVHKWGKGRAMRQFLALARPNPSGTPRSRKRSYLLGSQFQEREVQ